MAKVDCGLGVILLGEISAGFFFGILQNTPCNVADIGYNVSVVMNDTRQRNTKGRNVNILIMVGGSGVTLAEEQNGQLSGTIFAEQNCGSNKLRELIFKYQNPENVLVIEDVEFEGGYYTPTQHCGAGGVCHGYRLHRLPCNRHDVRNAFVMAAIFAK